MLGRVPKSELLEIVGSDQDFLAVGCLCCLRNQQMTEVVVRVFKLRWSPINVRLHVVDFHCWARETL